MVEVRRYLSVSCTILHITGCCKPVDTPKDATVPQTAPSIAASTIAPPERFNIAAHLMAANAGRADKAAFIDDHGSLSYGQLDDRARRLAAALRATGLKREERVLLLMLDGCDWPVAFLGAIYAGLVPVAVNTLLTADDYAYMLENSRAQAVLVSGALLPALTAAMTRSDHEVGRVVVSRPTAPLHPSEIEFESFLSAATPAAKPAATSADDAGFWLYSSGSTGRPETTRRSAFSTRSSASVGRWGGRSSRP